MEPGRTGAMTVPKQAPDRGRRPLLACLTIFIVTMCLVASGTARANQLITITIPDRQGEIPAKWLNYYTGEPRANVLLPDGYNPHKRYPLLVLLNPLNGDYDSYASGGDTTVFSGFPGIVVMPEGADGWYADWWNDGERNGPAWESYELNEVIPAILARFPILPGRRYHAIAGVSMGGLGAAYLGGRLPGFFGSVASLSGFVDPQYFAPVTDAALGIVSSAPQNGDEDWDAVYGPPYGFYATGHNPAQLVMNLQQTRVFVSSGNGDPSSAEMSQLNADNAAIACFDPSGGMCFTGDWATEKEIIYPMNQLYDRALVRAGIDLTYEVQPGGHDDPHFRQELKAMLAWGLFKPVVNNPTGWVNDTVATDGQLWDIGYRFAQPPGQVVQFRQIGDTLSIGAAGSAVTITTSQGCVIHTGTPATIQVPERSCMSTAPRRHRAQRGRDRRRSRRERHR
jgi:S-formylglutathione hydrolase FrmB